ncbi:MAG: hypothetical protein ABSH32_17070 [Bryobacteraceae bacterium]
MSEHCTIHPAHDTGVLIDNEHSGGGIAAKELRNLGTGANQSAASGGAPLALAGSEPSLRICNVTLR